MSLKELLTSAKNIIATVLALIMLPLTCLIPMEKHEAKKPEELITSFSVLSDCHVEGNNYKTFDVYTKILRDAKATDNDDAIVFLGDNTMNGQDIESIYFYGALKTVNPAEEIIVAPGNHDFSNGEGDYGTFSERFMNYNNLFLCAKLETPYFYRVIDDCYFIVLSTEEATVNTLYISDTQLQWLKNVLQNADESGNPIFVFNHYPVNYIENDDYYRLSDVLDDYDNLLYFCGHTHFELSHDSIDTVNGVECINIPRSTEHATEGYDCGIGAVVEVYEDEVLVRIRDFYDGLWLEGYEVSYPIN